VTVTTRGFRGFHRRALGSRHCPNLTSYKYEQVPYAWIDATEHAVTFGSCGGTVRRLQLNFTPRSARLTISSTLTSRSTGSGYALSLISRCRTRSAEHGDGAFGDIFIRRQHEDLYAPRRWRPLAAHHRRVNGSRCSRSGSLEMTLYGEQRYRFHTGHDLRRPPTIRLQLAIGTEDVNAYKAAVSAAGSGGHGVFLSTPYNYKPVAIPRAVFWIVKQRSRSTAPLSDRNGDALLPVELRDTYATGGSATARTDLHLRPRGRQRDADGERRLQAVRFPWALWSTPQPSPVAKAGDRIGPSATSSSSSIPRLFDSTRCADVQMDREDARQISATLSEQRIFPPARTAHLVVNDGTPTPAPSARPSVATSPPIVYFNPRHHYVYRGIRSSSSPGYDLTAIVAWSWRQVSENPVSLTVTNQQVLDFFVPKLQARHLVFEVTATDNLGAKTSVQATVQVLR